MCCLYTLTLSLNLVLHTPVSPMYSYKQPEQILKQMTLTLLQDIGAFNVNVLFTFLNVYFLDIDNDSQHSPHKSGYFLKPTSSLLSSALVSSFLKLDGCSLLLISLMLSKPEILFLLRTLTQFLIAFCTDGLFRLNKT